MVSGIDSSAVATGGNLSVLKKAIESEKTIMSSIINGMQDTQSNLQTQTPSQTAQPTQTSTTGTLDIMA